MIRLNKKIFISIALTILIALILISPVFASTLDPNQYNPNPSLKGSSFCFGTCNNRNKVYD